MKNKEHEKKDDPVFLEIRNAVLELTKTQEGSYRTLDFGDSAYIACNELGVLLEDRSLRYYLHHDGSATVEMWNSKGIQEADIDKTDFKDKFTSLLDGNGFLEE